MFQSFKTDNIKYSLIKIRDLINNYTIPKCQRKSLKSRIELLNNSMTFSFNPVTPLYFVLYKNEKYIIDGLHRLNVYKSNQSFLDKKIPIVEINVYQESEIEKYFKLINDNMTVHDIYLDKDCPENQNKIIINTYNYFINNYANSFKYGGKRRPYIDNNKFLDQLIELYKIKKNNIENDQDYIKILLELNDKYKNKSFDWYPSKGKVNNNNLIKLINKENCLYFGMLANEWHNHIDNMPDIISEDKISQRLRADVWEKNSNKQYEIKCYCCNTKVINALDFECGHIIPNSKGGKCNINNLIPVCSLCNKSMGNTHMDDFMKNHNYYENLKLIELKKIENK